MTVVSVYYRPPDPEEEANEALYGQLEVASQALVLRGDFNHPGICWKDNTARRTQSRTLLQSTDGNLFYAGGGGANEERCAVGPCTNNEGLVGDVKVVVSLGCSDHEMVEIRILHGGCKAINRITILDFRRSPGLLLFGLFKDLLGGIPWDKALRGRGRK